MRRREREKVRAKLTLVAIGFFFIWMASCAQRMKPGLTLSDVAWEQAKRAHAVAMISRKERGLCVASGGYEYGYTRDRKLWAIVYAFADTGPQAAVTDSADSNTLWWHETICGDTLPSFHTHLFAEDSVASKCDKQTLSRRPGVPFGLVQFAPGAVTMYSIIPGKHYILANDTTDYCGR